MNVGLSADAEIDINAPIFVDHELVTQSFINVPVEIGGAVL
jgi:hypothetical protein